MPTCADASVSGCGGGRKGRTMGIYINPSGQSKNAWLQENAVEIPGVPRDFSAVPGGAVMLCLANSGLFDALAVLYSDGELREFTRPDDMRPRSYFYAEEAKLPADVQEELRRTRAYQRSGA
jgi:hypothetical protein